MMVSPNYEWHQRIMEAGDPPWGPAGFPVLMPAGSPWSVHHWYDSLFEEQLPWFRGALHALPGSPVIANDAAFFVEASTAINARVGVGKGIYITITPGLFLASFRWCMLFARHCYSEDFAMPSLLSIHDEWAERVCGNVPKVVDEETAVALVVASENYASSMEAELQRCSHQEAVFRAIHFKVLTHFAIHHEIGHIVSGQIPRAMSQATALCLSETMSASDYGKWESGEHAWVFELLADDSAIDHLVRNFVIENQIYVEAGEGYATIVAEQALGLGTLDRRACCVAICMMAFWGMLNGHISDATPSHPAPAVRLANALSRLHASAVTLGRGDAFNVWLENGIAIVRPLYTLGLLEKIDLSDAWKTLSELCERKRSMMTSLRPFGILPNDSSVDVQLESIRQLRAIAQ